MPAVLANVATVGVAVTVTIVICAVCWRGKTCEYCQIRLGWLIVERSRREQWERQQVPEASREISTDDTASIPRLRGTRY